MITNYNTSDTTTRHKPDNIKHCAIAGKIIASTLACH